MLSTLAATVRTGAGGAWLETGGLASNCAAPAAVSLEFSDNEGMTSLPDERWSAAAVTRITRACALVAATAAAAACPDDIATALAGTSAASACAASWSFTLVSGVAKPTAGVESAAGAPAAGAEDGGAAPPRAVAATIAGAFAPVFVESVTLLAANVPGGELARPVDAGAGACAAFDAVLSALNPRAAGPAAARFAALLEISVPFAAPAAVTVVAIVAVVAVAGFGVEFALSAAVFRPPAPAAVAAALNALPFNGAVAPVADGTAAPTAGNSAVAGCVAAPDSTGGSGTAGVEGVPGTGDPATGAAEDIPAAGGTATGAAEDIPAAGGTASGAAAAGGGGGNGAGEELPPAGRWPPLESTPPAVMWIEVLRLGFPPASLKALAKSWLWAPIAPEFAAAALI